jgi:ATP phosphoribosyltransferase regulatory subunit HisZ
MSILNSIFGQIGQHVDVDNLATKLGIDPATAEKGIAALAKAHQQEGDTVQTAAAKTGLDAGVLSQMVEHIGGEGSLGEFSRVLHEHPQASSLLGSSQ